MDKPYEVPRPRLLPTLVFFLFVLGVLYTSFLIFQQYNLKRSLQSLGMEKASLETQMGELTAENIEELYVAKELKERVEDRAILWSKVLRSLESLTPVSVFISSYTALEDGSIQLSGLGDSFGSVADILSTLQNSSNFTDVFLPSLTLGETSDGQEVVSFSLKLFYSNL